MAASSFSNVNSARALSYLSERVEDAQAALRGVLGGAGPGGAGPSGAERYLGDVDLSGGQQGLSVLRNKLESTLEQDRLDGLRTVVAMISKGLPAADHVFPSVLKLTSAPSLQVKTLVYLVTLRLAPSQPDVALLSINSFQRDLSDASPLIRGMALRVLSGLGVKSAAALMEMAIARGVRDPNFYVRRIAADAIGKCCELSPSTQQTLMPHLATLLGDRHPSVLGSALLTFYCISPERWDLVHQNFRRICHALVDIDEWNQPVALRVLVSYARTNLPRPTKSQHSSSSSSEKAPSSQRQVAKYGLEMDADLDLLLVKTDTLLASQNAAVVLATVHAHVALLPGECEAMEALVQPVLRLLKAEHTQALMALLFSRRLAARRPELFRNTARAFLPLSSISSEPSYLTIQKLGMLVDLSMHRPLTTTEDLVFSELEEAALHRYETDVVLASIREIGRLAQHSQGRHTSDLVDILIKVIREHSGTSEDGKEANRIVSEGMGALRQIVRHRSASGSSTLTQEDADSIGGMIFRLAPLLFKDKDKASDKATASKSTNGSSSSLPSIGKSSIHDDQGRAGIYWFLGQYCRQSLNFRDPTDSSAAPLRKTLAETIMPDLLRKAAATFTKEGTAGKLSILNFSAKLYAFVPTTAAPAPLLKGVAALHAYIMQLGRFDLDYDVRDRARFLKNLTATLGGDPKSDANRGEGEGLDEEEEEEEEETSASGGIKLRREQVLLVLFEGKDQVPLPDPSAADAQDADLAVVLDPVRLALSADRPSQTMTIRDPATSIPPWTTDTSSLPPSSVRDPVDPSTLSTSKGALHPASAAGLLSLSSDNFTPAASPSGSKPSSLHRFPMSGQEDEDAVAIGDTSGIVSRFASSSNNASSSRPPKARAKIADAANVTTGGSVSALSGTARAGKYRDLDDFLNEESESSDSNSSSSSSSDDSSQGTDSGEESSDLEEEDINESSEEESGSEEETARGTVSRPLIPEARNEWASGN